MKPRARRVTLAAAVLGAGVVGVLVVLNWRAIHDHLEAWRFQLTVETETIEPSPKALTSYTCESAESGIVGLGSSVLCQMLARFSNLPAVFDPSEADADGTTYWLGARETLEGSEAVHALATLGYRAIEQRFPRRACVVIRDPAMLPREPTTETLLVPFGDPAK